MKICRSGIEALLEIRSDQRVFVHGASATPRALLEALVEDAQRLRNVELVHLHTVGPATYAEERFRENFRLSPFFVGANLRAAAKSGRIDYLPCLLSEIPQLLKSGRLPIDVALIHVSPPDRHGFCTLGTSVDIARAAVDTAKIVIAQINRQMPKIHGDGFIHVDRISSAIEIDEALPEEPVHSATGAELTIANHVASLVEDGSTLQTGIGAIPAATLGALKQHRRLGIHTETWTDAALELILCGAVDNSEKRVHRGCTVSGFLTGSKALYDFVDDNPSVIQLDVGYVNNPATIARNPKVVAINSAVEVDLTGQICADSIGTRMISGAGGQMDFIRGASLSEGGKPIIALTSRTKTGASRIVPTLKTGAGVVTTRAHVHCVVTEFGIADLYGKTLSQRAKLLTRIAHPEDRVGLERAWQERSRS